MVNRKQLIDGTSTEEMQKKQQTRYANVIYIILLEIYCIPDM